MILVLVAGVLIAVGFILMVYGFVDFNDPKEIDKEEVPNNLLPTEKV